MKYEDDQLTLTPALETETVIVRTYKLINLFELYFEYADILSNQGLVYEASAFIKLIPMDYKGSNSRQRILTNTIPVQSTTHAPTAVIPAVPSAPSALQFCFQATNGYPSVPVTSIHTPIPSPYSTSPANIPTSSVLAVSPYTTLTYAPVAPVTSLTQPPSASKAVFSRLGITIISKNVSGSVRSTAQIADTISICTSTCCSWINHRVSSTVNPTTTQTRSICLLYVITTVKSRPLCPSTYLPSEFWTICAICKSSNSPVSFWILCASS